jgi:queuine tRNA-ribosyltransferase
VTVARFEAEATDGPARAGCVFTARGSFLTPCFMPVGTKGAVKTLSAVDLEALGAEVVLANTYHLMLRPGVQTVAALGGLHRFEAWDRHLLTDSGGYQVFSLQPEIDEEGVTFRSTYDGSKHRLTPESAVTLQAALGADIQMALDICPGLPAPREAVQAAADRTLRWAERARVTRYNPSQSLFGIVQGGIDLDLRAQSAAATAALDFDGYGIGGLSVGEARHEMLPALAAAISQLPADRPRYLMGVGDPVSIVEAVALGVDMMDCVLPTRLARHGTVLTSQGRVQLKKAMYAQDDGPLDARCGCAVCGRHSRGYLRHLLMVGETSAARLLSLHNLAWLFDLMATTRRMVVDGALEGWRRQVAAQWEPAPAR